VSVPRRVLDTVFPITSFAATDETPRARLNTTSSPTTVQPAAAPSSIKAAAAIAMTQRPSTMLPPTHSHLRTGRARIAAATNSCGSSDSDSRTGTSRPMKNAGAPAAVSSHGSTSFALASSSPIFVHTLAPSCRKKLTGWSLQAASGMSLQTRASSSPVTRS
jgi:hypothetical protein